MRTVQPSDHGSCGCRSCHHPRGFTLVEVLVALSIVAIMAVLAWRGIDAIARSQQLTQQYTDDVLSLQAGLAQWHADLDAIMVWPALRGTPTHDSNSDMPQRSMFWDGRVLRLTRMDAGDAAAGLRVVAWTRRPADGYWLRWQSAAVYTQQTWQAAWEAAARWVESGAPMDTGQPSAQAVAVAVTQDWQLHYFRGNAWTNPLSSQGTDQAGSSLLPDAVRLLLTLAPGQAISGALTIDWVRPDFGGDRR